MPEATARRPALPVGFGLVRTVIPGARGLDADDLARAAGLALARDLGVTSRDVRLAARRATAFQETGDDCLIAWVEGAGTADAVDRTEWLTLADGEAVYWFDAPGGFAIGPGGLAELAPPGAALTDALPPALLMLIAASRGARELALVSPTQAPEAAQIALWEAASGLAVRSISEADLPTTERVALRPPPPRRAARGWSTFDRALAAVCVASLVLFGASLLPVLQTVSAPRSPATSNNAGAAAVAPVTSGSTAGLLLMRTLQAAPEAANALTAAEYADGRWVLSLRAGASLSSIERALALNGLAAQAVTEGEAVRIRVERRVP